MTDDPFEKLDELTDSLEENDEGMQSVRKRFEESDLWLEHKKWHEQQGTKPHLVIEEDERPIEAANSSPVDDEAPHVRLVKTGRCDCQPGNTTMEIDDKGVVVPGFPRVLGDARAYASSVDEPSSYGAAPKQRDIYTAGHHQKDLYR